MSRIEAGHAIFALDHDMLDAPLGWYRAVIEANGCEVADLMLLVRCGGNAVNGMRSFRVAV